MSMNIMLYSFHIYSVQNYSASDNLYINKSIIIKYMLYIIIHIIISYFSGTFRNLRKNILIFKIKINQFSIIYILRKY